MKQSDIFAHRAAIGALLDTREGASLLERDLAHVASLQRLTVDWVPMWVDRDHAVRSDKLSATAYRAITDDGVLLWYVCRDEKRVGYHSIAPTAVAAFADAAEKWARRREIKRNWDRLKRLRTDLILGRTSLTVTLDDAHASGLCVLGIKGFMRRVGIAGRTQISGRLAAMLMFVEPQVGFAIHESAVARGVFVRAAAGAGTRAASASV